MNTIQDCLGRRQRDRRNPLGMQIGLTGRDLLWFETLHRHGPLSSTFLLACSRSTHRSDGRAKDRLTHLYHERGKHGGPYLDLGARLDDRICRLHIQRGEFARQGE